MTWGLACCNCAHEWTVVLEDEDTDPDTEGICCPNCGSDLLNMEAR